MHKPKKLLISQRVNFVGHTLGCCWDLMRRNRQCTPLPWGKNFSNNHLPHRQLRHNHDHRKPSTKKISPDSQESMPPQDLVESKPLSFWSLDMGPINLSNSCFLGEEHQCPVDVSNEIHGTVQPLHNWASVSRWDSKNNQQLTNVKYFLIANNVPHPTPSLPSSNSSHTNLFSI